MIRMSMVLGFVYDVHEYRVLDLVIVDTTDERVPKTCV